VPDFGGLDNSFDAAIVRAREESLFGVYKESIQVNGFGA
jgi:hypothetical protein